MTLTRRQALAGAALVGPAGGAALPLVPFGPHRLSRLIVGGNPVSGNSHVSAALSREMRDYFTAANVKAMLRRSEECGINTWQSRGDRHILRLLNEYRLEGGRIQWIAQTASELADIPRHVRELASAGAIGVYHHGSATDKYWDAGKIDRVRDLLKVMRDAGVRVGLGTHIPEVIDYVESKDWDVDYYMTCLYNLSRPGQEQFREPDRELMLDRVRRTRRQCLLFKIYGAGRRCGSPEQMRAALREAFGAAKPSDCVVIGMFPKHREQVEENCRLVRETVR
jgi:hypothetical protein